MKAPASPIRGYHTSLTRKEFEQLIWWMNYGAVMDHWRPNADYMPKRLTRIVIDINRILGLDAPETKAAMVSLSEELSPPPLYSHWWEKWLDRGMSFLYPVDVSGLDESQHRALLNYACLGVVVRHMKAGNMDLIHCDIPGIFTQYADDTVFPNKGEFEILRWIREWFANRQRIFPQVENQPPGQEVIDES